MSIRVAIFRGQGIRVGNRHGVAHRYASPTEVIVRFKDGFETVATNQLLPVSNLQTLVTVTHRYHEKRFRA